MLINKKSFLPIITKDTHSLFLGTLPGEVSLAEHKYYAHPQNKFWRLIYDVFSTSYQEDYNQRIDYLLQKGFGLWDVLKNAEREGSLDSSIKNFEVNDFKKLQEAYPNIQRLYFTSQQAYKWYVKKYKENLNFELIVLASPSPANARMNYLQKLDDWKSKIKL